jgi:hypothetical protein
VTAIQGTPAVFVAYQLKLYSLLADRPSSLEEICKAKELKPRPPEAILAVTSLGITRLRQGRYSLTPAGEDYFIESSPTYCVALLDLTIDHYSLYSIESLKRAVMTDAPQAYGGGGAEMFKSHEEQPNSRASSGVRCAARAWRQRPHCQVKSVCRNIELCWTSRGLGCALDRRGQSMVQAECDRLRYRAGM